mgnify:CR=1 FL=1
MTPRYVRFERRTHLVSQLQGGEFSLCGVAFDAGDSENEPALRWQATDSTIVTCPDCIAVIDTCRGVRTRGAIKRALRRRA